MKIGRAYLLDEARHLLLDLLEPSLGVWRLGGVHLVDADDELLNAEGVGEEGVLAGLAVLGDAGLELASAGGDDEDAAIGLRGARDHVLDEIPVARGVDDGDVVLGGLELPESDINGDTTFTLGLQLVQNPSVLEGTLAHLEFKEVACQSNFTNFSVQKAENELNKADLQKN